MRNSSNRRSNGSKRSIQNHCSSNISSRVICFTCGDVGHKSFNCRKYPYRKWIWRPKATNHQGPQNGYLMKLIFLFCRSSPRNPTEKDCPCLIVDSSITCVDIKKTSIR